MIPSSGPHMMPSSAPRVALSSGPHEAPSSPPASGPQPPPSSPPASKPSPFPSPIHNDSSYDSDDSAAITDSLDVLIQEDIGGRGGKGYNAPSSSMRNDSHSESSSDESRDHDSG